MSRVFKNKTHNRIWAFMLALMMIVTTLAGTGLYEFFASLHVKAEAVLDKDNGIFKVSDDEIMVLEIVPDESMAQFGYLVKGQEPVNMELLDPAELISVYKTSENMQIGTGSDDIKEFEPFLDATKEEYDRIHPEKSILFPGLASTTERQYGEYKYNSEGNGEYILELTKVEVKDDPEHKGKFDYALETKNQQMTATKARQEVANSLSGINVADLDKLSDTDLCDYVTVDDARTNYGLVKDSNSEVYVDEYYQFEKSTVSDTSALYTMDYKKADATNLDKTHYKYYDRKFDYYEAANDIGGWTNDVSRNVDLVSGEVALSFSYNPSLASSLPKNQRYDVLYTRVFHRQTDRNHIWNDRETKYDYRPYYGSHNYYETKLVDTDDDTNFFGNGKITYTYTYITYVHSDTGEYVCTEDNSINLSDKKWNLNHYTKKYSEAGFRPMDDGDSDYTGSYIENTGYSIEKMGANEAKFAADIKEIGHGSGENIKKPAEDSNYVSSIEAFKEARANKRFLLVVDDEKVNRYLTPKTNGRYNIKFVYTMRPVRSGESGNYDFVGKNYKKSIEIKNGAENVKNQYQNEKKVDVPYRTLPDVWKGYLDTQDVYQAYVRKAVNQDPFKKWALGLGYVNGDYKQGEDYDSVIFSGWFKEPECINQIKDSEPVYENLTAYADWKITYGNGNEKKKVKITFNPNSDDTVINMPFDDKPVISDGRFTKNAVTIYAGNKLVKPDAEPKLAGKVFEGWITDKNVTTSAIDYRQPITSDITLYANWRDLTASDEYKITFSSNLEPGKTEESTGIKSDERDTMPTKVTGPAIYFANGEMTGVGEYNKKTPERNDGYTFGGWYLEQECINRFEWGDSVKKEYDDKVITLFAKWVKGEKKTIAFNANKPTGVTASPANIPTSTQVNFGSGPAISGSTPTLKGNVEGRLDSKKVKVITVSPYNLDKYTKCNNGSYVKNMSLIQRANLIVINESCSPDIRNIWTRLNNNHKRRTDLFPENSYNGKTSFSGSNGKDLTWTQVQKLFEKIAGANGNTPCPVIFDYAIYTNAIAHGSKGLVDIIRPFGDGKYYSNHAVEGINSNIYKLYLLITQANPITLYNAYRIKEQLIDSNGKYNASAGSTYTNGEYWNNLTLAPLNVITRSEWGSNDNMHSESLEVVGFNLDTSIASESNALYNRVFVYGREGGTTGINSVVEGFVHDAFKTQANPDKGAEAVFNYFGDKSDYSPAEICYYLLNEISNYSNFTTDLSILEIEPSNTYKSDDFWFWYISRCIPNYLGKPHVKGVTSSEFNGMVEDISSNYDIVYFGVADQTLNQELLFNVDKYSNTEASPEHDSFVPGVNYTNYGDTLVSEQIEVPVTQTINVAFYKKVKTDGDITEIWVSDQYHDADANGLGGTPYKVPKIENIVYAKDGIMRLNTSALGSYADIFQFDVKTETAPSVNIDFILFEISASVLDYYRLKRSNGTYFKFNSIELRSNVDVDGNPLVKFYEYGTNRETDFFRENRTSIIDAINHPFSTLIDFLRGGLTGIEAVVGNKYTTGIEKNESFLGINFSKIGDFFRSLFGFDREGETEYSNCYWNLKEFYWGIKKKENTEGWKYCDPGTVAYEGETIKLLNVVDEYKVLNYNYVYTHVGSSLLHEENRSLTPQEQIREIIKYYLSNGHYDYPSYLALLGTLSASDGSDDDNASFMFSGNDITMAKYKELLDFAETGHHPIVFGRDVIDKDGTVNEGMIDSSTNIYRLFSRLIADNSNHDKCFEVLKSDYDDKLAESIKRNAFSLEVVPKQSAYLGVNGEGHEEHALSGGNNTLEYELRITNNSGVGTYYSVAVYVDTNADGKFAPSDEIIEDIAVTDTSTMTQIADTRLQAGVRYILKAEIPNDYEDGIAHWQLVVTDLTTRKRSGATGKVGVESLSVNKPQIYVLQIEADPDSSNPNQADVVKLPTQEEIAGTLNDTYRSRMIYDKTKDLQDYDIVYCRQKESELKRLFSTGGDNPPVGTGSDGNPILFDDINVIVLGCGRRYQLKEDSVISKIEGCITAGKPVIFTNDTTSYINLKEKPSSTVTLKFGFLPATTSWPSNIDFWGYKNNKHFRELLGMDRFSVTKNHGVFDTVNNLDPDKNDKPYVLNENRGSIYSENTDKLGERALVQGFNNTTVAMQFKDNTFVDYVVPINDGQITSYPYRIDPAGITVGKTHAQYYQLNLEKDDITVWYALTSDKNKGSEPHDASVNELYYAADAVNNYYLYTRGNITYCGIGASTPSEEEIKLFINTIIAASRTGVKPTLPIITNIEKASSRGGNDYLYIDYDASLARNDEESTPFGEGIDSRTNATFGKYWVKRVYFKLKDYSIIDNKQMIIEAMPAVRDADDALIDVGNRTVAPTVHECDEFGNEIGVPQKISFYYGTGVDQKKYEGSVVETADADGNPKYYYMDIPISDNYYQYNLYGKSSPSEYVSTITDADGNVLPAFKALDLSDAFLFNLRVITRYGESTGLSSGTVNADGIRELGECKNNPLIGRKGVCIMRRGMFALD